MFSVGLHILVCAFIYIHTLCLRAAKALARLRKCAGSSEHSLPTDAISINISCTGSIPFYPELRNGRATKINRFTVAVHRSMKNILLYEKLLILKRYTISRSDSL